jgi:hypothetical protein
MQPVLQIPFRLIPFSLTGENYWGEIRRSDVVLVNNTEATRPIELAKCSA